MSGESVGFRFDQVNWIINNNIHVSAEHISLLSTNPAGGRKRTPSPGVTSQRDLPVCTQPSEGDDIQGVEYI